MKKLLIMIHTQIAMLITIIIEMATTGNENPFFGRKIRLQLIEIEREIVQKGMATTHTHTPSHMGKWVGGERLRER
jgi:hypothetical protein